MIRKATVSIPYIVWRDGRPRFEPGPGQRKLGYKGRDLKHQDGTWFSYEQAVAESQRIEVEASARKQGRAQGQRLPRLAMPAQGRTLSQVVDDFFALPEHMGKLVVDGKRVRHPLSSVTVAGYLKYQRLVQQACDRLDDDGTWHMPVALIGPKRMQALVNEIERHSGLVQARKAKGFLSTVWTKCAAKQPGAIKGLFLELDTLPMAPSRVRPWEPAEFWHMVQTADRLGRHDVADCLFWGVLHGDRQTDRLQPTIISRSETHITLKLSKTRNSTGVHTVKLLDPWLRARFAAADQRRRQHTVQWPHLTIDEAAQRPWHPSGDHYRHVFTMVRDEAARTMPTLIDQVDAQGNVISRGIRDQDLRDTNQTWLDRASVDPRTMSLVAGHAHGDKHTDLQKRHYVAANQARMDNAVMAISTMLTTTAPASMKEQTA